MKTMNLPTSVKSLIQAQERHDGDAYAKNFLPDAKVFDEGRTHEGHDEIRQWIQRANAKYKTVMEPVEYRETSSGGILKAKITGSFEGSPAVLKYYFNFRENLISSLEITG
jgi:hypothetical protein